MNAVKPVSKPVTHVFASILARFFQSKQKNLKIDLKKHDKCRKNGSKASKHIFSPIIWQQYIRSTQKILQSAKKVTLNGVKPVSKPTNTVFALILATVPPIYAK